MVTLAPRNFVEAGEVIHRHFEAGLAMVLAKKGAGAQEETSL